MSSTAAAAAAAAAAAGDASGSNSAATVHVTGLSPTTTQQSLEEYFSFVGTIQSATLERDDNEKQKATLTFLRSSAASNAAM